MINSKVLQRLVWKEAKQAWPLVLALSVIAFIMCVLIHMKLHREASELMMRSMSWRSMETLRAIMLPSLVALGIPVLLISNEREFGHDVWMRSLPTHWSLVIGAKLIVAFGAVFLMTGVLACLEWIFQSELVGDTVYIGVRANWQLSSQLAFSVQLMLVGFVSSLLVRSTIGSVLTVVPLALMAAALSVMIIMTLGAVTEVEQDSFLDVVGPFMVSGLLLCWILEIARRQYGMPAANEKIAKDTPNEAYRSGLVLQYSRPGMVKALLWQQVMQTLPYAALAFAMALLGSAPMMPSDLISPDNRSLGVVFALYGMTLLGLMAFCLESPGGQQTFLASRGIAPATVWWTRMFFPAALAASAMLAWYIMSRRFDVDAIAIAYTLFALGGAFTIGVMAGMWIQRPAVAVFTAPVGSILLLTTVMTELKYDNGVLLVPCIGIAAVLLIATYFLVPMWMDDRRDRAFHMRACGWIGSSLALAVLLLAATLPFMTPTGEDELYAKTIFTGRKPSKMMRWRVGEFDGTFESLQSDSRYSYGR